MPHDSRALHLVAVAAAGLAVATLGLGLVIVLVFPTSAELARGFQTPVLAFELARTEADLAFLTGPDAAAVRAQMDRGHAWDMAFPFAYGGMLALLLVQLALQHERLMWLGVPFALATIPADVRENLVLLDITATLEQGRSAAALLPVLDTATWLKWGALAIGLGVLAIGLLRRGVRLAGGLAAAGAAMIGLTRLTGSNAIIAELMTVVVFAFFLTAGIRAIAAAWRLSRSAPAAPA